MDAELPQINIKAKALSNLDKALETEWLVTNGLGGYASSTILGVNTRKYHGLLIAAFNPPVDRRVLLTKLDEEIRVGDQPYFLGSNEFRQGLQPEGYRWLSNFSIAPLPTFTYNIGRLFQLTKTIFMPQGQNATIVRYKAINTSEKAIQVRIAPLVNSRHFHTVTEGDKAPWSLVQKPFDQGVTMQPSTGLSTLQLFSKEGRYRTGEGKWVESFLRVEASRVERSFDSSKQSGLFELDVAPHETRSFSVVAVAGRSEDETERILSSICRDPYSIDRLYGIELQRRAAILSNFGKRHLGVRLEDWLKWLVLAADTFIVDRASTKTKSVIAGYHWFEDWGRDSLISLPGLTLVTGRFRDAKQILLTFQHYCDRGIVPNRFPDSSGQRPVYNTVDATLWYFNAVLQYLKYTYDFQFVQERLWDTMTSIIEQHVQGTVFDIHMDQDGLIAHGPQLTWMDAAPHGRPVTPREGKAVEIQALWYNALKIMQLLANRYDQRDRANEYLSMAEEAKKGFAKEFWNPQKNCLFDVVAPNGQKDDSLRPNQVMAVSLDFTMLDKARADRVVETVKKRLWTLYGLRTLSDDDPKYAGKYKGDWTQRDTAYHNGIVWPWLVGPFVTAFLKLKNYEEEWRGFAFKSFLQPLFQDQVYRMGLGTISEIFNGDSPHEPNGAISQAWSVAEPLRAFIEDISLKRPQYEQQILNTLS